jgi:hypothetical protein
MTSYSSWIGSPEADATRDLAIARRDENPVGEHDDGELDRSRPVTCAPSPPCAIARMRASRSGSSAESWARDSVARQEIA